MNTVDAVARMPRDDPAKWSSLALSAAVHLLLIGALFIGVQWKSKPPTAVEVELWQAPPATVLSDPLESTPAPETRPAPKPEAKPVARPEPPPIAKPLPKAEPRPEAKPEPKPIAKAEPPRAPLKADMPIKEDKKLKEPPREEPKRREVTKKEEAREPVRKEVPKREEPKAKAVTEKEVVKPKDLPKKPEPERRPSFDDELKREQKQLQQQKVSQEQRGRVAEADAEARQLKQLRDEQASNQRARARELAAYIEKVRGKIRGNINLPPGIQGNPEAIFEVTQLPTGEVLDVKVRRSSGNPALDNAVERAIRRSSPLPKPADPELFERVLKIPYRPRDE